MSRTHPGSRAGIVTAPPPPQPDLIAWAAVEAGRLLAPLPQRWAHTQEVAVHAWWAGAGLDREDRELLVAAAYLHDVGHSPAVVDTGFHPLDGARHLHRLGQPQLARLVAHHSGAAVEARHRGLDAALAAFPPLEGAVADALTYCDLTTGPGGETVDPGPRLEEVVRRHGLGSVVARSRAEARVQMHAAVIRTLRRVARARPAAGAFAVDTVQLGCTGLLRLEGRLEGPADAAALVAAVQALLEGEPHALVADLALLQRCTPDAVAQLSTALRGVAVRTVLLEPPAQLRSALLATPRTTSGIGDVTTSAHDALVPQCACW